MEMEMEMEMEMACDRGKGLARGEKKLGLLERREGGSISLSLILFISITTSKLQYQAHRVNRAQHDPTQSLHCIRVWCTKGLKIKQRLFFFAKQGRRGRMECVRWLFLF